jgi:hypothetical protein
MAFFHQKLVPFLLKTQLIMATTPVKWSCSHRHFMQSIIFHTITKIQDGHQSSKMEWWPSLL